MATKRWERGPAAKWIRRAWGLAVIRRGEGVATVTRAGVDSFGGRWPNSGFPDSAVTFCWDDSGLLDITGRGWDGDEIDGAAVSAMFDDVRDYCDGPAGAPGVQS